MNGTVGVEKGFLMRTVAFDGGEIKYVVYVPPTYRPEEPMPTIIFLNGMGECGTDGLKQISVGLGAAVTRNVNAWPFLIVFPQKQVTEDRWLEEDEMVMAVLEKTREEFSVDNSRLYLTGISQGGHGTWDIGAKHRDLFAAIAPVCGWGDKQTAEMLVGVPVWAFHGEADDVVPVRATIKMAEHLNNAGGSCKVSLYPGVMHNSWDKAYQEESIPQWFLENRLSVEG